jgi:CcmD family protein
VNLEYVFAAYALILFVIFAYVLYFSRRQSKLEHEIEELRRLLENRSSDRDR